jgi:hypothetical protein
VTVGNSVGKYGMKIILGEFIDGSSAPTLISTSTLPKNLLNKEPNLSGYSSCHISPDA